MNRSFAKRPRYGRVVLTGLAWTIARAAFLALYAWSWTWVL